MTKRLNLDTMHPEPKLLTLGGKQFDVTRMPLAIFLDIQKRSEEKPLQLPEYRQILTTWLQKLDPAVTPDWIESVTDDLQLMIAIREQIFNSVFSDPLPNWTSDLVETELEKKTKNS